MADTRPAMPPEPEPDASSPALEHPVTTDAATPEGAEPVPEQVPEPAPEPAPEPSPQPSPEPAAADLLLATEVVESAAEPGPTAARRPLRTSVLLLAAALVGPLLGAGVGYTIQAARPATPLPPLKAAQPKYPATPADSKAVEVALPKPISIDGDLRKLLISKPDGAEDWNYTEDPGGNTGWLSISDKARSYGQSAAEFRRYLGNGYRRDAFLAWKKGGTKYIVELLQYDKDDTQSAIDQVTRLKTDYGHSEALEGTLDGSVSASTVAEHYADSTETFYRGEATARRGTVVMLITAFSPNQVNAEELKDLAKRQWERLK